MIEITGVTWTDDDGTTYERVWTEDGPKDIDVSSGTVRDSEDNSTEGRDE